MSRILASLLAIVFTGFLSTAEAQSSMLDYPQWRGQQRDGAASGFIAPKLWPEALTRRWRVEVGEGYATPLVVGDTVYIFTRRNGEEVLTALSASAGAEKWHTSYAAPYVPSQAAAKHGAGPKATPLFHEGRLFTLGISGVVSAFDAANGKLLWQTPAPTEHPFFSAASSPVGDDGIVLTHPRNYDPLTAFDTNTGAIKWRVGDGGFFQSPIIATLDQTRQVVTVTQKNVIGVSLAGELLWEYPWPGAAGGTMPVLYGETILVSGLDVGMAALKPARRDGKWTAETVWTTKAVSMYVSNPVVIGDTIFGLSHRASGQFFALDAKAGSVLWLGAPREATNTAIAKSADLLFLLNDDAELIVGRSTRTGFEAIKRYTVAESATWAQPTISGNRIFVKDVSTLTLWTVD